jgi:hypothetical protein
MHHSFKIGTNMTRGIFLTFAIAGGSCLFGATPNQITTAFGPIGVAATSSELLFTQPFCDGSVSRGVYKVDPATGNNSLLALIPNPTGLCVENYIAISPGYPGFPAGNAYVTSDATIYQVTPTGVRTALTVTGSTLTSSEGHSGIAFNTATGQLLFTSTGGVWTINSSHVATSLAGGICPDCFIESPTTDASGNIFITLEDDTAPALGGAGPNSGIYRVAGGLLVETVSMGNKAAPEAIHFVLPVQCGLTIKGTTYGGFLSVYSPTIVAQLQPAGSLIDGYLLSDIGAQAGNAIVGFEYSPGPLTTFGFSTPQTLNTFGDDMEVMTPGTPPTFTSFGNVPNQLEGFNTVACGPATGCPATKGFWHKPGNWTNASVVVGGITYDGATHSMTIGGVTYTQTQLLLFLPTGQPPAGGNGFIIGGSQLIAAVLNIAAGAQYSSSVTDAISSFDTDVMGIHMISGGAIIGPPSNPLNSQLVNLGGVLDNYNSAVGLGCSEGSGLNTGSGK